MRIHHATAKKAEALGIKLVAADDNGIDYVTGTSARGAIFRDADAKRVVVLCTVADVLATEHRALRLAQDAAHLTPSVWADSYGDEPFYEVDGGPLDHDNLLADILEAADDAGVETDTDEEEEETGRVVVAARYKIEYAERGNRNHCGDWLAKQLENKFDMSVDGNLRFDADAFTTCLIDNGVELTGKWAALPTSGQKGWVGRYRMNGRQRLEFQVAKNGFLMLRGEQIDVPADELAHLRGKHPKAVAKTEE